MSPVSTSYLSTFPYLYRGVIKSVDDPLNLGRCKIHIPSIYGSKDIDPEILPWSRPIANTSVSAERGSYSIPEVSDIVWVLFEGGDRESPVYFGGTYGQGELEVDNDKYLIYQNGPDSIYYSKDGTFSVNIGGNEFSVDSSGGITLRGQKVYVNSSGEIVLEAPTVRVNGDLYISGKGNLNNEAILTCPSRYRKGGELLPRLFILTTKVAVVFCCTFLEVTFTGR